MNISSAKADILLLMALLFASISPIFAQSYSNDTLRLLNKPRVKQQFDFEKVAKQLTGLSDPPVAIPEKDSLSKKIRSKVMRDLKATHGHIDLGYAYGLNTVFIDTARSIGTILNTSGDFSTAISGLPVNVSFHYSTLKVPLGTNNYFRISLDKNRLVEQQKQKLTASIADIDKQQESINGKRAELNGLMGYVELYLDQLKRLAARETESRKQAMRAKLQDTLTSIKPGMPDTSRIRNFSRPDLNNPLDYQLYYDSVMKIYQRISTLKSGLDSLSDKLSASREVLSSYQAQLSAPELEGSGITKLGFLQSVQTFDIGLSYPKTTAMSGQNVPIKGLHLEIQQRKYYLSVASGLTLNNLMLSTNEIQNKLNYNQNVFNNFDFQQVMNNGWLTAIKTGYGTPEGTHAFVGFNYLTNTRFLNPAGDQSPADYDPAASVELDLRYVPLILKGSSFDLVYGKTSLNKRLDTVTDLGVFQSVFSGYRSNLFLTRYTQSLSRLRSDFSVSYRRIDPYVNTSTFGMMQPNNQRIEWKTNHRLTKFMKLGLLYRWEETLHTTPESGNLNLSVAGATLSGNYTRFFNYSFFVNHIHHKILLPQSSMVQRGNNYLIGTSLISTYELGSTTANTQITYNDYLITDTTSLSKYTQFGLTQTISEKDYSVSVSYNYFFRSVDEVSSGTNVFGLSGKYNLKKVKLGAGLKLASDFLDENSMGGHLEVLWEAYKFLDVSFRAERFVLGDFYRNYYRSQYEQFPYLITLQTRFKI